MRVKRDVKNRYWLGYGLGYQAFCPVFHFLKFCSLAFCPLAFCPGFDLDYTAEICRQPLVYRIKLINNVITNTEQYAKHAQYGIPLQLLILLVKFSWTFSLLLVSMLQSIQQSAALELGKLSSIEQQHNSEDQFLNVPRRRKADIVTKVITQQRSLMLVFLEPNYQKMETLMVLKKQRAFNILNR